jgi:hypothetical protein
MRSRLSNRRAFGVRVPHRHGLKLLLLTVVALALVPVSTAALRMRDCGPMKVKVFMARGAVGNDCARVAAVGRVVPGPSVLTQTLRALLAGPNTAEKRAGYHGWFSAKTKGMLRSARISNGVAYIDLRDFSRIIPNASSSCGSALLLAQLNRTATQFSTVKRAIFSFNGSRSAFYEWLQREAP